MTTGVTQILDDTELELIYVTVPAQLYRLPLDHFQSFNDSNSV